MTTGLSPRVRGNHPRRLLRPDPERSIPAGAGEPQWRLAPSGHLAGIDYSGAEAAARGLGIPSEVFEGLRVMEAEALAVSRERG